jgi:glycosyltransferase involved in cell wall biosynthesis
LIGGRHAMIADDDANFVDAVVRLLSDERLRASIAREARRLAETEYSWDSITSAFEELYREILAHRAVAA